MIYTKNLQAALKSRAKALEEFLSRRNPAGTNKLLERAAFALEMLERERDALRSEIQAMRGGRTLPVTVTVRWKEEKP
jgi:hypothetical protein